MNARPRSTTTGLPIREADPDLGRSTVQSRNSLIREAERLLPIAFRTRLKKENSSLSAATIRRCWPSPGNCYATRMARFCFWMSHGYRCDASLPALAAGGRRLM